MDFRYLTLYTINWTVSKVPFFFSKKMVWISEDFFNKQDKEDQFSLKYDIVKTYSLLDSRLNWKLKAVSSVCSLSAEQVNAIHKWKRKTQLHRFRPVDKTSINNSGWFNLGYFRTNARKGYNETISLGTESKYISGCSVYLYAFTGGTYYLSTYWFFTDEATLLVKDIDVSGFDNKTTKYFTCNPFNSIYGASSNNTKINLSEDVLRKGIDKIFNEIDFLDKKLKNILSIKSNSKPVRNLDVLVKEDMPYFYDQESFKDIIEERKSTSNSTLQLDEAFLDRSPPFFTDFTNKTEKEFLLNGLIVSDFPFNNIFIKSEKLTEQQKKEIAYATYERMPCHILDSHNMFAIYQSVNQDFSDINDKYADYILNDNFDANEHYDELYKAYIEIEALEKKLKNIMSKYSKTEFGYREVGDCRSIFFNYCSNTLSRVSEVKEDIGQRKQNTNELVQSGNLKYQKKNAQIVVFLVMIQIGLAYLTLNDDMIQELITPTHLSMYFGVIMFFMLYKPLKRFFLVIKKKLF